MKKKELIDENNRLKKENDYLRLQMAVIKELLDSSVEGLVYDHDESVKKLGKALYYCDGSTIKENIDFIVGFDKPYNFFCPDIKIVERD